MKKAAERYYFQVMTHATDADGWRNVFHVELSKAEYEESQRKGMISAERMAELPPESEWGVVGWCIEP